MVSDIITHDWAVGEKYSSANSGKSINYNSKKIKISENLFITFISRVTE